MPTVIKSQNQLFISTHVHFETPTIINLMEEKKEEETETEIK
jgi:hypothetical protein